MPTDEQMLAEFKRLAEINVNTAKQSGFDLDYSGASTDTLDKIIQDLWGDKPPVMLDNMVAIFGSYLGEVFVRELGGRWILQNGTWGVDIPLSDRSSAFVNVFYKVRKRLTNGPEDSLGYYFQGTKNIAQHGLPGDK